MADVIMPQMGESIFEGTITKWLKKPGDKIERDEPLFEISTDKVDAEIPSPSAGVLKEIKVNEGQTVPIQTVVAVIVADGASTSAGASSAASAPAPAPAKAEAPAQVSVPSKTEAPPKPAPSPAPSAPRAAAPSSAHRRHRSGPTARKFAALHLSGASRAKTTSTSRKSPAPAPVAASASTIFAPPSKAAARLEAHPVFRQLPPRQHARPLLRLLPQEAPLHPLF